MKQIFINATFTNFLEAEDSNDYENFFSIQTSIQKRYVHNNNTMFPRENLCCRCNGNNVNNCVHEGDTEWPHLSTAHQGVTIIPKNASQSSVFLTLCCLEKQIIIEFGIFWYVYTNFKKKCIIFIPHVWNIQFCQHCCLQDF